jgi:hypothetical protein
LAEAISRPAGDHMQGSWGILFSATSSMGASIEAKDECIFLRILFDLFHSIRLTSYSRLNHLQTRAVMLPFYPSVGIFPHAGQKRSELLYRLCNKFAPLTSTYTFLTSSYDSYPGKSMWRMSSISRPLRRSPQSRSRT